MRRSEQDRLLQELYDRVPKMVGCTGKCWISCGPAEMSNRERQRARERGFKLTPIEVGVMKREVHWCEALTEDHRCAIYEARPLVCRLWGTVAKMKCPYGCTPEGGWLSDREALELLAEAERIGGAGLVPSDRALSEYSIIPESGGVELRMQYNLPPAFRKPERIFPCPRCSFTLTIPDGNTDVDVQCAHCMSFIKVPDGV